LSKLSITAIILTFNEAKHLRRCIESLVGVVERVIVVDSYSTDATLEIAKNLGAEVVQNPWVNYASQFQWALDNCAIRTDWILRIDADEYATPAFRQEALATLPSISQDTVGIFINVDVYFIDRIIKYGGHYPIRGIRMWRKGMGRLEQKFMDEKIVLEPGGTISFQHSLIDHNLNQLVWWTGKQNGYALREAADLLNQELGIFEEKTVFDPGADATTRRKKYLKNNLYNRAPLFLRVFLYFFYRYFIRLGFLDGKTGLLWHFLQGFWVRLLVDGIIYQVKHTSKITGRPIKDVLVEDYHLKI
jgi:glycosyltransferase involved in cell wall biosynthesis